MRRTGRREERDKIKITEEMISAAAEVLSANEGWVFGYGSVQEAAKEMLACALAARSEASDKAPH